MRLRRELEKALKEMRERLLALNLERAEMQEE